jgi:uncharacterized membrane protein YidH (DUF202 family)
MPGRDERSSTAAQRTDLAWIRSGLAICLVVGVVLRRVSIDDRGSAFVLILAGTGLAAWSVGFWIAHRLASRGGESSALGAGTLRLVSAGTVLIASASFVAAMFASP